MNCAEARAALGVDVLGALDPAESTELREHLAGCPDCQAAQAELADVPTLLGLVSADEVIDGFPHPDERGLERLQERVRAERGRERRGRWRTALVAAALVAIAVGGGGWAVGRWVTPHQPVALPTPSAQPTTPSASAQPTTPSPGPSSATPHLTAPPVEWSAVDPDSNVNAVVTMNPVAWGTKVDIVLTGVKKGDVCSLVVYDASGNRWDGGSWKVAYDKGVRWSGGVAVSADQVSRIEIFAPGYESIVKLEG
ncbi:zf-HC2 domain-containing protein [Actinopolymorpha sp. B11F2]|uniref:zf-HC2 domain-containing protein n=1 Tax=Actinopolymorpha sp. B11F2 TaxID=3160862 RepID=UPI0032E519D7